MPKWLDVPRYGYGGYFNTPSICRVRIYRSGDDLPVVIVTQLPENEGTSVTNMAEYLAAEILMKYLPQQDGLMSPFVYVEHYPDDCAFPEVFHSRGRHQDAASAERFSGVTFTHCNPRQVVYWNFVPRVKFGSVKWRHMSREELEVLIGETWLEEFETDYPQRVRASA